MISVQNGEISSRIFEHYLYNLVGRFYKILPLRESASSTLQTYIESFKSELIGQRELIYLLNDDPRFLSLIGILQFLNDNPCNVTTIKREVMKSIDISKKLYQAYSGKEWAK